MSMWSDIDNGLYCMFMNKVEIMDAVVNELQSDEEGYAEEYDGDALDMVRAACINLGYDYKDLSSSDYYDIYKRMGWK